MSSVAPPLPPTKAEKRKHGAQEEGVGQEVRSSKLSRSRSTSPSPSSKKARSIGPAFSPATWDERSPNQPDRDADRSSDDDDDDDDEDDDFGPSLPTGKPEHPAASTEDKIATDGPRAPAAVKGQRDEWMIVPPTSGDWSSRIDPTKLKNRKFNSGKGAQGPTQGSGNESNTNWTETPAEKQARLRREMMGIKDTSTVAASAKVDDAFSRESARKLREYNEKSRGSTLYKEHQKTNPQEKEDDPSARAFDREKDIAGGMKINHTQRRQMMNKAADFGSRFSAGKFL